MVSTGNFCLFIFITLYPGVISQWIQFGYDFEYHIEVIRPREPAKWDQARANCMSQAADLVSIHSQEEATFLQDRIESDPSYPTRYWTGLNRLDRASEFSWSDGTPVDFTLWDMNYPILPDTHDWLCAYFGQHSIHAYWKNINCGEEIAYICKRPQNLTDTSPITDPPTTPVPGYCPEGYYGTGTGNKCFKVVPASESSLSHEDAIRKCRESTNGYAPHLASIESPLENNLVVALAFNAGATEKLWIGYHSSSIYTYWLWTDGSTGGYQNWAFSEPAISGYAAAAIIDARHHLALNWDAGEWFAEEYTNKYGYVCEIFKDPSSIVETPAPITGDCPEDYFFWGTGCYRLITNSGSWQDSEDQCLRQQGHLVSIDTPYENALIAALTANSPRQVWIGLTDNGTEGTYHWSDGWPVIYTNWGIGQPDPPSGGGCVYMSHHDYKWYDTYCDNFNPKICKIDHTAIPTPPANIPNGTCPDEWAQFGEHCYYFQTSTRSWYQAQQECANHDIRSYLATIHSYDENQFIYDRMTRAAPRPDLYQYWIGMYKSRTGREYEWITGEAVNYINWAPNEPSDIDDDSICVYMHDFGDTYDTLWGDRSCTNAGYSICKMHRIIYNPVEPTGYGTCLEGWVAHGDKCYLFVPDSFTTWTLAEAECIQQAGVGGEGHLVTIENWELSSFIHNEMVARTRLPDLRQYWIGLSRNSEEIYRWVESGAPVDFNHWQDGYPRYDTFQCVQADTGNFAFWRDITCSSLNGYVCQAPQREVLQESGGLSGGAIAAIILGVLAGVILIIAAAFFILDRYGIISVPYVPFGKKEDQSILFRNGVDNPVHIDTNQASIAGATHDESPPV